MNVTFDDRDLRKFAKHLKAAPDLVVGDVVKLLDRHAQNAAQTARDAAPRDRPWLSTPEGLVVQSPDKLVRRIVSPLDGEGQSVGYRVEYGTSMMAPRPFLGPAVRKARAAFESDALEMLVRRTL